MSRWENEYLWFAIKDYTAGAGEARPELESVTERLRATSGVSDDRDAIRQEVAQLRTDMQELKAILSSIASDREEAPGPGPLIPERCDNGDAILVDASESEVKPMSECGPETPRPPWLVLPKSSPQYVDATLLAPTD